MILTFPIFLIQYFNFSCKKQKNDNIDNNGDVDSLNTGVRTGISKGRKRLVMLSLPLDWYVIDP